MTTMESIVLLLLGMAIRDLWPRVMQRVFPAKNHDDDDQPRLPPAR
jgi:hypothetical protein